jgi:hypothetical protein
MFWPGRGGKQSGRRAVISSSQSSCTSYCKSMNRGTAGRGASPHMQSSHQVEESPLGMQLLRSSPSCSSALSAPAFHFQSSFSTFSPRSTQTIRLRTHPPARITEPKQPRVAGLTEVSITRIQRGTPCGAIDLRWATCAELSTLSGLLVCCLGAHGRPACRANWETLVRQRCLLRW